MGTPSDHRWYHFMFNTYGTWLRGDERGFRDHDHRVHSSGDYNSPPPIGEHAGLRRWTIEHMHKKPVRLDDALKPRVGRAIVDKLLAKGVELITLAVMPDHVHGLGCFLPSEKEKLVGDAKRTSSHAIRAEVPGQIWARKCRFKAIRDHEHQRNTFAYILDHAKEGAWVWSFRDGRPR